MSKEKNIILTGASGDIGREIIRYFSTKNYKIYCFLRKENKDFKIIKSLKKKNIGAIYKVDLNNTKKLENIFNSLRKKKIIFNHIINCAGTAHGGLFRLTKILNIKRVFDDNFFGILNFIQLFERVLKRNDCSSIINISSITAFLALQGTLSYGASKTALNHATKVLANEFAINGIRVNGIAPTIVNSKMIDKMSSSSKEKFLNESFSKKIIQPIEIAQLAEFLCSNKSKNINGSIIKIDGGMKN